MKPSNVAAIALASLMLVPDGALAGSGIGKGSPSNAARVLALPPPPVEISASGTVADVYANLASFSCHCGSNYWTFATTAGTVFQKGTSPASFAALTAGSAVTIQYHFDGSNAVTDQVVIAP